MKPNPFRFYHVDGVIVEQIIESIERTSLWECKIGPVRKTAAGYEIAAGHCVLAAAKRLYGLDREITLQLEEYTDAQMIFAMAHRNYKDANLFFSWRQNSAVRASRDLLRRQPGLCKLPDVLPGKRKHHGHGSEVCVRAFLGAICEDWDIESLLKSAERQDAENLLMEHGLL